MVKLKFIYVIILGWIGPKVDDIKTMVSLDILFRYWCETCASPLNQIFVECENPIANEIDMSVRPFLNSFISHQYSSTKKFEMIALKETKQIQKIMKKITR